MLSFSTLLPAAFHKIPEIQETGEVGDVKKN